MWSAARGRTRSAGALLAAVCERYASDAFSFFREYTAAVAEEFEAGGVVRFPPGIRRGVGGLGCPREPRE
eukprot:7939909-Lingulodinium_polyedra.AAC.1